ncbi:MAG: hypothetical protein JOZ41_02455, partial [Chloroflexi bacterium]|nr:hypothetical protein [Chloroflexota bacterium]
MATTYLPANHLPGSGVDRAAERALREEVRQAVGRLLGERELLSPGP